MKRNTLTQPFSVRHLLAPAAVALAVITSTAHATTNGFFVPAFRGSLDSEFGYWENFGTNVNGPHVPDQPGATTDAELTQSNFGAIQTGTFNIYNPATSNAFTLSDSVSFTLGTVVLQTFTQGTELDYANVALSYDDGSGLQTLGAVQEGELSCATGGLGENVAHYWQWDLTGLDVTEYEINFAATGPHDSFDALTLDTYAIFAAVPEPSTAALLACGGVLAAWGFSRRRTKTIVER